MCVCYLPVCAEVPKLDLLTSSFPPSPPGSPCLLKWTQTPTLFTYNHNTLPDCYYTMQPSDRCCFTKLHVSRRTIYVAVHDEKLVLLFRIQGCRSAVHCERKQTHSHTTDNNVSPREPPKGINKVVCLITLEQVHIHNSKYWAFGVSFGNCLV